ncbi:MAG TPA: pseudouridylate synthase [Candidatus Sphingobacterium stercoripullorum]|uniref:tRNA pseudouridine synthase C n=1 Tax=Candidatus Sphingobacterium stercoripullorum TaxID=2838759 RepID=A0A9D2AYH9_9SPHI|nr:pseudouridylate synthase [Candidatus Sphingobacterium stercoripullorum]
MLEICYQDQDLVAINKPNGLLVHRSSIAKDTHEFALQLLRDQLQQVVYPIHRLDRKTSGVLLFALNKNTLKDISKLFEENAVDKNYFAIVRGHTEESGIIDTPLTNEKGQIQQATTHYKTIARAEIPLASTRYPTSRYSLVKVNPITGRMHQIRKHFAHIRHPILGDRPHGCNKQNKLWKETYDLHTMLLHAQELRFRPSVNSGEIVIRADVPNEFLRVLNLLDIHEEFFRAVL